MDPRALQKRSGLVGLRRTFEMPLPSMMTKPNEEVRQAIKKTLKVFKPK
jgi:hypothetical protein